MARLYCFVRNARISHIARIERKASVDPHRRSGLCGLAPLAPLQRGCPNGASAVLLRRSERTRELVFTSRRWDLQRSSSASLLEPATGPGPDEPLSDGTPLAPELAAESVGLELKAFRYERALRHLVREGALVWEERLGGCRGWTTTGSPSAAWR